MEGYAAMLVNIRMYICFKIHRVKFDIGSKMPFEGNLKKTEGGP